MTVAARQLGPADLPEQPRADDAGGVGRASRPEATTPAPAPETRILGRPDSTDAPSTRLPRSGTARVRDLRERDKERVRAGLIRANPDIPIKLLGDFYGLDAIEADCLPESKSFDRESLNRTIVELLREYAGHLRAKERERAKRVTRNL